MDQTELFVRCPRVLGHAWGLGALLLCTWVLAGCGNAVPDDKTYVNVQVTGRAAEMTTLNVTAMLAGGKSFAFDQVDLTDRSFDHLVLEFSRELRGTLTVSVSASGTGCNLASGSATVMLAGQPEADVTVALSQAAALSKIAISAAYSKMAAGHQQRFTAMGTFADSTSKDLSSLVKWSSSNAAVATIDATGLVAATGPGTTSIGAALSCQAGATNLAVVQAGTARFKQPVGVAVDGSGSIYVADIYNSTIRKITPVGVVSTFAGSPGMTGNANGTGSDARFDHPYGLALDGGGNLYVADDSANEIRKITPAGVVTTLAGMGTGSKDGTGLDAQFNQPTLMAADKSGNLYLADYGNDTIRKITPAGVVSTVAGTAGIPGSKDGPALMAQFKNPGGVAVDGSGSLYVSDSLNGTIRKITSAGVVSTMAGSAGMMDNVDGTGAAARFYQPAGIVMDGNGNLYVADSVGATIRKVTPAGMVTTLAGSAKAPGGSVDGSCTDARFNNPVGLALDGAGNLIVADDLNDTIRKITLPDCVVTTLAGSPGQSGSSD